MERKVLIRNISYMERELTDMKRELALLDAKTELLEQKECQPKQLYKSDHRIRAMSVV